MRRAYLVGALTLAAVGAQWTPQESGSTAELRGLAARDATTAFATGSGGTVLRTLDGERWEKRVVPGGEKLDFRDVELLDGGLVVLMSAGPGDLSRIYRSTDRGSTWSLVHTNPDKDGFYDAISFWDRDHGLVLGDPVAGRFRIRLTDDGGATWTDAPGAGMPSALPGEGAFAASGTCLEAFAGGREAWFVTGGADVSRVFRTADRGRTWSASTTPVAAGAPSAGLFSIAFLDARRGFALGGDYKQPALETLNGVRTEDGGATWIAAPVTRAGYFSAVRRIPGTERGLLAGGPAGIARSDDAGATWSIESPAAVNALAVAPAGRATETGPDAAWAAGPKGTILRRARP